LANLKEELDGASPNMLLLHCARGGFTCWQTKPDGPWTVGFFEILQHITNIALKTHASRMDSG